ncbi:ATP-binding protein [Halobacillus massiliensis]|uniref:ATP-binding protein n=1 Tax=Halobacillus massiliensis TaxID=1926286 RepID=UPI0009E5D53C|nr:ATP-binding protein [Halobacillus massiliensis]
MNQKQDLIESLTGIRSSKKSYYTELKKTVAQMKKKNTELEIINDMMKNFNVEMPLEEMLENLLNKLNLIFNFTRLGLALIEGGHLFLKHVYPLNLHSLKIGSEIHENKSLYWQSIKQQKAIFRTQPPKEKLSYVEEETFSHLQLRSQCILPLVSNGKVIGVFSLGSKEIIEYSQADQSFFQQLANQFAVCIQNARLYSEVVQSKKEWEDTFHGVQDLLVVVDTKGFIQRFNTAVSRFLQAADDQIYGQSLQTVFSLTDTENESLLVKSLFKGSQVNEQILLRDNRIFDVSIFPVYEEETEGNQGAILNMKDVTERVHMESQLMQSAKLAAIGEMAAGVAHELNSPLTAILGNSQLLMRKFNKEEQPYRMLEDIRNCGNRSKRIISNLLTFSRQDDMLFEGCSINAAVEQVISLIGYQIERQNIDLELQLSNDLPQFDGNLQQIEQIVINLLINAKDELEECRNSNKTIKVQTHFQIIDETEWVILKVCDNGRGIPEANQTDVFYPFFTTKAASKGTGLGLSVSLGIAKTHGGSLEIHSEQGEGSCFFLKIPAIVNDVEGEG